MHVRVKTPLGAPVPMTPGGLERERESRRLDGEGFNPEVSEGWGFGGDHLGAGEFRERSLLGLKEG